MIKKIFIPNSENENINLTESDEEINIKKNHNNKIDYNKKSLNDNLNEKINEI